MTSAEFLAEYGGAEMKPAKAKKAKAKKAVIALPSTKQYHTMIGIDPGTNTGVAIKLNGNLVGVETMTIIEAIQCVTGWAENQKDDVLVRIEDARLRTFFGSSGSEMWKGAGSIMRDCKIWEDEMKRQGINVEFVHPKNVKATTADYFKKLTGWRYRTSIHAREAAWMII